MLDRSRCAALLLASLAGCATPAPPRTAEVPIATAPAPIAKTAGVDPARLHVLMINGGGIPAINYQSHLAHLRQVRALLLASGARADQIDVLSSDGDDPAPDLASREAPPEADFWMLEGTRVGKRLDTPVSLTSSTVPGVRLTQASKKNLGRWFDEEGRKLRAGDTLLVYVTDHGTRQNDDPLDNRITLWGREESISARELGALLGGLSPGVRVVTLMSQCFSGGFGHLAWGHLTDGEPAGDVCGYFSSTADRPAYGCFLENRGKEGVGHSFDFARALAGSGRLADAHLDVLASDMTPDVPLRTSDLYLTSVLARAAAAAGHPPDAHADALIHEALRDPAAWEPEIRLLDRLAQAFGCFSPRSLGELADQEEKLPQITDQLGTFGRAWDTALADATAVNLEHFVRARPAWAPRLADPALVGLDPGGARALARDLLGELAPFTRAEAAGAARLQKLHDRSDATEALGYRMEVRLAAALRMRAVLTSIAGRAYLAKAGRAAERRAYQDLRACEDLALPHPSPPAAPAAPLAVYPPLDEDMKLARTVLPGWMGVSFQALSAEAHAKRPLPEGAALVTLVYPDSPAKAAGFEVGDVVLGPPGAPFDGRNQLRAFTMLSPVDAPAPLDVLRGAEPRTLTLIPKPFPMKWPALPGPTELGAAAPPLDLQPYRGPVKAALAAGAPRLLYFWATWCGPCKAAVPEVLAFEQEKKIPVVAITDEAPEVLDAFFKARKEPFPKTVGLDALRKSFIAYGVSGTPTFVLIDDKGAVRGYQTGYAAAKGIGAPGWTWSGRR